ncbi:MULTISPECIES: EAL domain-containing protein [Aliiglaciecola]|uniref:EAL domain-containing protein n=1 Tax=Aliiglaciecola TaxID=1406885 RepID=UPI001C0A0D54|nr:MULTISPECIES: EAL domain-containing protein [Aliiglaciecola]MBU2877580.1 EAL domain-containing protein [Aliiglaciecola lipolytica]MDO6711160.1 EAL domain-containing protein [Aliiglaciecola sp. 2_MG-2023]MDO6752074.1 EAL domain-containing protein [Aliiglaciecola sp. 1_MG-2023]
MFKKLKNRVVVCGLTHFCQFLRLVLCASFAFFSVSQVSAAPLINEPKFTQLSTSQGLSQDTVNDLLIDSSGFLWVATQAGLNRFDGYRVKHFDGNQMQLADISIDTIFEDNNQNIWVGTRRSGLFKIDTKTGETTLIEDFSEGESTWSDRVTSINQLANNQIIVSTERSVYIVSPDLGRASLLYKLPEYKQVAKYQINATLFLEDRLLLGRSDGLFEIELNTGNERQIKLKDKTSDEPITKLFLASDNKIWIGSEIGLFCLMFDENNQFGLIDHALSIPILEIYETSYGSLYIGSEQGLFSYDPPSAQLQHYFSPSDSRYYLSSDNVTAVDMDNKGNLWIGSSFDGALYWSTQSVKFENVSQNKDETIQLSSNSVKSFAQFNDDGLWIGTSNGLNYYDLKEHELRGHWFTEDIVGLKRARIRDIETFGDTTLLLNTDGGLWSFDTITNTFSPPKSVNSDVAKLLNSRMDSFAKDNNGFYWLSNLEKFYKYDAVTGVVTEVDTLNEQIDASASYGFLSVSKLFKDILWIAQREQLWAYNTQSDSLQSVHKLERASMGQPVYPESIVEDNNGTLWIAYPGAGLVGLDSTIYTPKYGFDKKDLLPSNMIYGIHQDKSGSIWMSSHAGLLKFDPSGPYLQQYGISQGLDGKEFNGLSHIVLQDGRLVYGSQKGLTIFDPLAFEAHDGNPPQVSITSIKLSSNSLKMPLVNLDKRVVLLDHKDAGLTIEFSTLSFEHQNTTQYQYRLDGTDSYIYPATTDSQVTFPKLDPGEYIFSAIAFDPTTGVESSPASVHIFVKYSPWLSPAAYAIYIFIFVSLVLFWWYRRDLQNKQVMAAHGQALQSKNRLTLALSASNSNVWEWRSDTNQFYAPRISDELDYKSDDNLMSFDAHLDLIHEDDRALFESNWQAFIDKNSHGLDVTYRLRARNGEWFWYRDVGNEVVDHSGLRSVVAGTYSNVTETVADREKVRLFGEAFKHTRDWVVIFNTEMVPVAVNTAFCEAFGIDENGDLKTQLNRLFKLNAEYPPRFWKKLSELGVTGHWKGEEQLVIDNDKVSNVLINMTSIASMRAQGEIDYYLMIMSDISEQKEAENELRRLANFDGLTNLPNRTLLLDRIKHGIDHAARHKSKMGIFFIDLDRFKQVNDSLGHKAGDELLKVVAQRLTNLLRQDDTVARLGGDEFVVMVEEVKHPDRLSILAQQLIEILEAPIQLGNQTVSVSSSVGIAIYPGDADTPEELLRNADLAMYHAKEQGRSDFQYFTQHMNEKAQDRLLMENRLKKAHQSKAFINYYQPIVNINTGVVGGFELLMRWPDTNGMVPPDQFIPVAEELGLIENMTWDALERAMPVLSEWQSKGREVYLSVNLSARHFERQISIDHIVLLLEQYGLPVSTLRFEITESALMRDYERALHYMESMREHGFIIALDDFGTGYSSLKYLKEFPIQVLKVDKSFVDDIGKNKSNEALVLTTLRMAESLDMYCVAEGIEQQEQIDFFKLHGCNHLQGYFYSKPVPEDETAALLAKSWLQ